MERFALQKTWQRQVDKAVRRHHTPTKQNLVHGDAPSGDCGRKRRVRIDVVKILMQARLHDDKVERIKQQRAVLIETQLQQTATIPFESFPSLQERCIATIAASLAQYCASCLYTQHFFASLEPWMITRISELSTAFKTMNNDNACLLLRQPTEQLTIGYVRHERAIELLTKVNETRANQQWTWHHRLNGGGGGLIECWDDLEIDEEDLQLVEEEEGEVELKSLTLFSCRGLSIQFLFKLSRARPSLTHLEITDCFDPIDSKDAITLFKYLAAWTSIQTIKLSWCHGLPQKH